MLQRMASRVCYRCGTKTHMTLVEGSGRIMQVPKTLNNWILSAAYTCDECQAMSIGQRREKVEVSPGPAEPRLEIAGVQSWLPLHAAEIEFADVPEQVGGAASEAFKCHSVAAYRAACSLARSVIEATAKDKGITVSGIAPKIDAMVSQGLLRAHIAEAAHEVRHLGNEMAHGDFVLPVDEEDSALVMELMTDVLEEVYASPARVARAKEARELRKQQRTAPA
jgi:hypothetical protein